MENKKYVMYGIGALILIGIVVLIIYLNKKPVAAVLPIGTNGSSTNNTSPCIPYTQQQYDKELSAVRSKCNPQLLVPILGIGLYNKCVSNGKQGIPLINIC